MDIRGIEVTNQLRSAIRAKLLELGVRYDEELPDYILVMVVNKKSRQQMHEDLNLFLEDSTTPFVDWLHDQVLKKLQKVTVAKKKTSRDFVPTVVVKQEEERKKKKTSTTSFLEDQAAEQSIEKPINKNSKEEKSLHKQSSKPSVCSQSLEPSHSKTTDKCSKQISIENRLTDIPIHTSYPENLPKKVQQTNSQTYFAVKEPTISETPVAKCPLSRHDTKISDTATRHLKRSLTTAGQEAIDKGNSGVKRSKLSEEKDDVVEDNIKKLKSCINKPKVTSVVSVKNRLGVVSPRKKFEIYREKQEIENRHRQLEKRFEKHRFDTNRNSNFQRGRNMEGDERIKKNRENESRYHDVEKVNDIKNRLGTVKPDRLTKTTELKLDKVNTNVKAKMPEKFTGTVKDRLGITNNCKNQTKSVVKLKEGTEYKSLKCLEQDREIVINNKNIKNRLGPLKNNFKPIGNKATLPVSGKRSQSSEDDDCLNLGAEEGLEDDTRSVVPTGLLKSHIIAVRKASPIKTEKKRLKPLEKTGTLNNLDEEDVEESKLPSKVIVTPRPLKPLQPVQKRATQSLLLRAVAEANQSVVRQKNPEPSLVDKKPVLKRLKPPASRETGQNLSVHFNASKRLVMEKIQVELNTTESLHSENKPYVPQSVTEEHMDVVMSLFQRSDDNQKFLVTLNGYNNNMMKEKATSDDEERLEMEVDEDDEFALLTTQNELYITNEADSSVFRITDVENPNSSGKERNEENNENCNIENVDIMDDVPRKKRKLSPIVYNRSQSSSPTELKTTAVLNTSLITKRTDKRLFTETVQPTVIDKTREKCRYWPNCTLGNKCAYTHPVVMCSAFPACKFGDKCAYKHPKCKFGLSCTKLGCVFSHPTQQCKYHPFCTKPSCPYSHPVSQTTVSVEATSQRAKFTWRRRD